MMKRPKDICGCISITLLAGLAIFVIPLIIFPCTAFCDEGVMMKESSSLWPGEIDGWKITEGPALYDSTTAYKYMNGAAELFIAFNMRTLNVLKYEKSGQPAITLEGFRMATPEDAYGIFSFESDDPRAGIGQGSEFGGGLLRFWKGSYFVSIYGDSPGASVETATLRLGEQIAAVIKETGNLPRILSLFPEGLTPYAKKQTWFIHSHILLNQRFFVAYENILNLAGDVNAALGLYSNLKEKVHLLLVQYPSLIRAEDALRSFKKGYLADGIGKNPIKTENNKWTAAEKHGNYLVIVFDAPDAQFALQMIELAAERLKEGK
jgi:hypothetical protein